MIAHDTALRACMSEDPAEAFRAAVESLRSLPLHCAAWVAGDGSGVLGTHPDGEEFPVELLELAARALRVEVRPLPALSDAAGLRYPAGEVLLLPVASSGTPLGGVLLVAPAGAFGAEPDPWAQLGAALGCVAARHQALRRAEEEREVLRKRAEEVEALDVLALATNRTLDPDKVLPLVARFARTLLGADYVTVNTCEAGEVRARSAVGLRGGPAAAEPDLLALRVVEAGRVVQVGAEEELPPSELALNRREGMESGVGVPLALFGETFGALVVGYRTPYRVTRRDLRLALALARHAAVAISNAQLHRAVEERSRELEEAYRQLRELTGAKERFYNGISHDLRTPVGAVKGYCELLLDGVAGELPEKARRYVGNALRASQTLLALVNDLLDFARLEAGKMELSPRRCVLREIVEDALASTRPQAEAKGLRLAAGLPDLPPLWTDPARVCQVLVNLLANGIKFTSDGEVALTAALLPAEGGGAAGLEVRVSDTGPGIAPEYRERIFAEFEQIPGSQGTGLGLPVSRRLARLLGGELWVESEVGRGSTFVLRLPGCVAAAQDDPHPHHPEAAMHATRRTLGSVTAAAALAVLAACAPRADTPPPDDVPRLLVCARTGAADSAAREIGPEGGAVDVRGNRLAVPAGAVGQGVRFVLVEPATDTVAVLVRPDVRFQRQAGLTLSYRRCPDPLPIPADSLRVYRRTGSRWNAVGGPVQLDAAGRTVTVQLDSLSQYALGGGG